MGAVIPILTATSAVLKLKSMNDAQEYKNRKSQYSRQDLLRQKRNEMAKKRANRHVRGFSGRTLDKSLDNISNIYKERLGNIYQGGDNTLGKVNLLAKAFNSIEKGKR